MQFLKYFRLTPCVIQKTCYIITWQKINDKETMDISFATKELKKCGNSVQYAHKKLGAPRAEIFFKRIQTLYAATCFEDLRHAPGKFHELRENRKGQWACDLDQPYRLIISPAVLPDVDKNGRYRWESATDSIVVEIVNYHKER